MKNLLSRLWQRRWLRFLVWSFLTLITLALFAIQWLNWYGARQWRDTVTALKADGEIVVFLDTLPPDVPQAENYCTIPPLLNLAMPEGDTPEAVQAKARRDRLSTLQLPTSAPEKGQKSPARAPTGRGGQLGAAYAYDLPAWAAWLNAVTPGQPTHTTLSPAQQVLACLSAHEPLILELEAGLDRPSAQWTPTLRQQVLPKYLHAIQLPHMAAVNNTSGVLTLRSVALLEAGEVERAFRSLRVQFRLSEACYHDAVLISQVVAWHNTQTLLQGVWESCQRHAGSAADYRQLEADLLRQNLSGNFLRTLHTEKAMGAETIQALKQARLKQVAALYTRPSSHESPLHHQLFNAFPWIIPSGWFDLNAANLTQAYQEYMIHPMRDGGPQAVIQESDRLQRKLEDVSKSPWLHASEFFTALTLPGFNSVFPRMQYAEALQNQAIIACVLEQHYLQHRSYPESLDGLTLHNSQPLPLDPVNHLPMRYERLSPGGYKLWSLGPDWVDDGGTIKLKETEPHKTRLYGRDYQGDWVWAVGQ